MKKQLILSLALFVMAFSFAQKKELKTLVKAVKNSNYAEAKTVISQLEPMLSTMDDKSKAKYYLNKGKAFFANGAGTGEDVMVAVESLGNIKGNDSAGEIADLKKLMEKDLLQDANTLFTNKSYKEAAPVFYNLYKIVPADAEYLYYAAYSASNGEDYDNALKYYQKLIEIGYTGVKTEYFAINKETGEEELFDKGTRDTYVKLKTHISPGERQSESRTADITKSIALIYERQGNFDKALEAIKAARALDPDNTALMISEANTQYKLGNVEAYEKLTKEAVSKDPNNVGLLFNLGVVSSNAGKKEEAKEYYKKVIALEPNNMDTLKNMTVLVLESDKTIFDEMNSLGNSKADDARYEALTKKRHEIYKEAIPYLEAIVNSANPDADFARTLMNMYSALNETAKEKEIKEKFKF